MRLLERRIILQTAGEEDTTCIHMLYEANGAHTIFPRRYRLWARLEKVLGRGPREYHLWLETKEGTRMGFSSRVLSLDRTREGTWKVWNKFMEKPLV